MISVRPQIKQFFGRFPAAREAYAETPLFHQTHSRYLPGILAEGLQPNHRLFPQKHGEFLLRMYRQYSAPVEQHQIDYITSRILDPSVVYLSSVHPDEAFMDYGVPERLLFLMRGLATLATKTSLTNRERTFAAQALAEHHAAITEGSPQQVTLEIDPLAPAAMNARLSRHNLTGTTNEEDAVWMMRYVDGNGRNNIALREAIEPTFIHVSRQVPLDREPLDSVHDAAPGWAQYIR